MLVESGYGFRIDEEIAEELGLFDEYSAYVGDSEMEEVLLDSFEGKYGIRPTEVIYTNPDTMYDLEGFEYSSYYILFNEDLNTCDLDELINMLNSIEIEVGYADWKVEGEDWI